MIFTMIDQKLTVVAVFLIGFVCEAVGDIIYNCHGLCNWDQSCCGYMLCCDDFIIWRLWYFWFLIILFIIALSSCAGVCRYRRRRGLVVSSYQPIATTHVATYQTVQPVGVMGPPAYSPSAPPPGYATAAPPGYYTPAPPYKGP